VIGINAYPGYLSEEWEEAWDATADALSAAIERLRGGRERRDPEFRAARRRLINDHMDAGARVTLDTFLDHIMHAVEVAGPEHVAMGSDFDGVWALPEGLATASDWQAVAEGLRARGLSEDELRGVMRDNARRVVEQVIGR
jgi:membrane dipeptidase